MTPRPIIIDTDPGQDDAVALLLALACEDALDVLGVTAVAGNVPLRLTARNARIVRELAGRLEVPVYAGAEKPLLRAPVSAEAVHGATGLDGPALPEPSLPLAEGHAVDFIVATLRAYRPGAVTLATLGPLTNIALAFAKAPDVIARVRELVMMGGAWSEGGNITPCAEFNIYADPHAAAAVFASGVPITVLPLDVTHRALTTRARLERLRGLGNRAGVVVAEMLAFYERFDVAKYGSDGAPLHDPCVIAWLLAPGLFDGREVNVEVETASPLTLGMTVVDWWGVSGRAPNARFIRQIDAEGFYALLSERLARLP